VDIRFTAIYASTLQRAMTTAQALLDAQKFPRPPLITSDMLREQHFGIAEGEIWTLHKEPGLSFADHIAKGLYPVPCDTDTFPEGESSEDLSRRAEKVVQELLLPHVRKAASDGTKGTHVAVVSHGLCIGEIIRTLIRMDTSEAITTMEFGGLRNTAWARVSVEVKVQCSTPISL
jgi:broad specificity phosphatase PhoE